MSKLWMKTTTTKKRVGLTPIGVPTGGRFSAPDSVWNRKLADNAPLVAGDTQALKFAHQCRYTDTSTPLAGGFPSPYNVSTNISNYSIPLWIVPANYPTTRVQWIDHGAKANLTQFSGLQSKFENVPLPQGYTASQLRTGPDVPKVGEWPDWSVAIYQPSTDKYWEFFVFRSDYGSASIGGPFPWTCDFGGYQERMSETKGFYGMFGSNVGWGMRSSSIHAVHGLMMGQEYLDGVFPHALAVSSCVRTGASVQPAQRSDLGGGYTNARQNPPGNGANTLADAIDHGIHLRLPASYVPAPGMPNLARMIAIALRDYGMFIVDTAGCVTFYGEDMSSLNTPFNPLTTYPWTGIGNPVNLSSIPFEQLQRVAYVAPV